MTEKQRERERGVWGGEWGVGGVEQITPSEVLPHLTGVALTVTMVPTCVHEHSASPNCRSATDAVTQFTRVWRSAHAHVARSSQRNKQPSSR